MEDAYTFSERMVQPALTLIVHEHTVMYFNTSSSKITGALRYSTACHSIKFNGVIANNA